MIYYVGLLNRGRRYSQVQSRGSISNSQYYLVIFQFYSHYIQLISFYFESYCQQFSQDNLVMILKRLLSLSFCAKQKYSRLGSRFNFSSNQHKQPQNQAQTQNITPPQNNNQQAPNEVAEKNVANVQKPWKKREKYQDEQKWYQVTIAEKYLHYTKPELDIQKLLSELEKMGSEKQMKQRVEEQMRNIEKRKQIPLQKYEKQLNLYTDSLAQLSASKSFIDPNRKKNRMNIEEQKNNLFRSCTREQFNNICLSSQKIRVTEKDLKQIYQILEQHPSRSYLINLFYQEVISNRNFNPLPQRFIHVIKNNIISGLYPEANPLKFLWFAIKQHHQLCKQYAPLYVRQLNKLQLNNKPINNQLKQLSYFYLTQKTSSRIVQNLLGISKNVEQLIKNWYITMMIVSRIKKQSNSSAQIHHIINLIGEQRVRNFFKKTLLKILLQDNHLIMFQRYKSALQKNQQSIQINPEQSSFDIEHLTNNSIVQYSFENDLPIVCELGKKKVNNIPFKSVEYSIVQNLVKGNYQSYLQYYKNNFVDDEQEILKIVQYEKEAQNQFESKEQQALYVFKKILKRPNPPNYQNFDLTKGLLGNIFKNLRNSNVSTPLQGGNKFFKNKTNSRQNLNLQEKAEEKKTENKQEQTQIKSEKQSNEVTKKERKEKKGFNKKQIASFSTTKNSGLEEQQKITKVESEKHYQQYLRTVKQTGEQLNKKQKQNNKILEEQLLFKPSEIFDFKQCKNVEDIENQFKKHIREINENNIGNVMRSYSLIPVVSNINVLLKFYFYNFKSENILPAKIQSDLKIEFKSTIGEIDKNYSEYLKGCIFLFPLPNELYNQLLSDQQKKFSRQNFKRVVAHMMLYMSQIPHKFIEKICILCERQKIGITLLQIINLINIRNIKLERNSLSKIASSIQHFKNMQSDLLNFVKIYCNRQNIQIETKLFEPYIANLTMTESYEQLNDFLQILIQELKPKEYKINKKLSKEQNLLAQKEFKQKQSKRSNRQLFQMIKITANSLKVRTKIPPFMAQILEMYLSKKTDPMKSEEYGISLIVYSQDNDKFMDYLERVKKDTNQNTQYVFECAVKCLTLFANKLKDKTDKILASTLYKKRFDLNQNFLKQLGHIFRQIDNPSTYTEYLQYVLRTQPPTTPEIKSLYYKIFNSSTDDNSKNQMNGLLDFIFNPNREKQRIQYKLIKQQEQKKIQFLETLNTQALQEAEKQSSAQSNKNQIKQKKKGKKDKQVEQTEPKLQASDQKIETEVKEKKKSKNKQKKSVKQEQKQAENKVAKQKKEQKKEKEQKGIEIVTSEQLRQKKQLKQLAKIESSFSIDKNGSIVYTPKIWSRDLRTRSVKTFSQNFMEKFTVKTEQEPQKQKETKSKSKKSKQGQKKQGDKKEVSKKPKQKQAVASKKK